MNISGKIRKQKVLIIISVFSLVIVGIAMLRTSFAKSGEIDEKVQSAPTEVIPDLATQTKTPATLVKLRLYDVGILPRQATVPVGNVNFAVEDFTSSECKIVIEQEETDKNKPLKKVGKIKDNEKTGRLRKVTSFAPGRYWISMEDKPDNRMLLIVENPK